MQGLTQHLTTQMGGAHRPLRVVPNRPAARGAPPFEKIAIVGLDLVGGSLALAARETWPSALVIGVDTRQVLEKALARHAVDVASCDLHIIGDAGLVVISASVSETLRLLEELPAHLDRPTVITDVANPKGAIVEAAARLPSRLTFIGGHAILGDCGSEIDHARADLFAERPWVLTPAADDQGGALDRLRELATGLKARPLTMTAEEHDRLFAWLSYLPRVVTSMLIEGAGRHVGSEGLALADLDLAAMAAHAAAPPETWREVCEATRAHLGTALDDLLALLLELRRSLGDGDALERLLSSAHAWRQRMPKPQ